jgi:hypothetical protein
LKAAHLPVQEFAVMAIHVVLDPAAHFKKCVASSEVPKPEHAGLND